MRQFKFKLLLVALVVGGLCATAAYADSYTYTVTLTNEPNPSYDTEFSFTESTLASSGDSTSITQISGASVAGFYWNSEAVSSCPFGGIPGYANTCVAFAPFPSGGGDLESFTLGSFLAPGIYTSLGGDETVEITAVAPEGGTAAMYLLLASLSCFGAILFRSRRRQYRTSNRLICSFSSKSSL